MSKTISLCFLAFALIGQILAADSDDKNIICRQAKDHGDKDCQDPKGGSLFYFDTITFHCQPFAFAGCSGNENRFATLEECKANCGQIKPIPKPNPKILAVPKCPDGIRSAVDSEARVLNCSAGDACPDGYKCSGDLCCPSSKATVCDVEYDTGRYQAAIPKHSPLYYYDNSIDNCKIFSYLGALGNANNFATYNECMNYCSKRRNGGAA